MSGSFGLSPVLGWAVDIAAALILLGLVCSFARLVKGPSLPDRVVSLDLITTLAVAVAGLFALASGEYSYIDVAVGLALVDFLATIAFAWYADKRTEQFEEFRKAEPGETGQ